MPYRHAHYFVGFVLLVTVTGFWASYFTRIGGVPLAFHVHAFSATSWLLLLIAQSLTIQNRRPAVHRLMGRASFALFPLLIAGFVMIINVSAQRYATAESPFIMQLGPAFAIGMVVAIAAYLVLFYGALRYRANIRLHSGYMLATPLILFESPFSRMMDQFFPWMNFIGSEGPRGLLDTIVISDGMVAVFALAMYFRDRRHGTPWLIAAGFVTFQALAMFTAQSWPGLEQAFTAYAAVPPAVTILAGVLLAAATGWAGWQRGKKVRTPQKTPAAAG
ncbi:hypothetical protein [Allopontixanthobacter sp.]|uniref:hypothetical protein n=1 Tax=Allopontixanthobacter sp. TaxID=2906452 RepID=UPI002ABAA85D|nr:hypothetical protein [Allopontixanthobacter sp.]MDZ4306282.1 hypothetical protein [Allopontixanthobacter sp.]